MHFGNIREMSVKFGKDQNIKKVPDAFWKTPVVLRQRSS